jgi:hypothetical protein
MWHRVACLAAVLSLGVPVRALEQTPDSPAVTAPSPKPQFFAGVVTELDDGHIKVSRKLVGRPAESRTFLVDSNTKMNKAAIRTKSRVTVRYKRVPEGDLALEIQARPVSRPTKAP